MTPVRSTESRGAAAPTISEATRSRLVLQGYACEPGSAVEAAARWLRFTPALSTLCIIAGSVLRSPAVLWAFAGISSLGAAGWHPFDATFNLGVRHLVGAEPLPVNRAPRRFAMMIAGVWSAGAGALIAAGFLKTGMVVGISLALAGALVATTHFCLGSWMYHLIWGGRTRRPDPRHV